MPAPLNRDKTFLNPAVSRTFSPLPKTPAVITPASSSSNSMLAKRVTLWRKASQAAVFRPMNSLT